MTDSIEEPENSNFIFSTHDIKGFSDIEQKVDLLLNNTSTGISTFNSLSVVEGLNIGTFTTDFDVYSFYGSIKILVRVPTVF